MLGYTRFVFLALSILLSMALAINSASPQNLGASSYEYLTDSENTLFNEWLPFNSSDEFFGPVHSNMPLKIVGSTLFFDSVSTSAESLWIQPGASPYFAIDPAFGRPFVALPYRADDLRAAAAEVELFFDDNDGTLASRIVLSDENGWRLSQWPMGLVFMDSVIATGPPLSGEVIFVDGYLELKGVMRGIGTIGAAGNSLGMGKSCIRLIDDVRYWFADSLTGLFNDTTGVFTDMLGIVSEGDIVVGNTWENGRDNRAAGSDIVITAALVALDQSFTFEDQNDNASCTWEYSTGYLGPYVDDRGTIHLNGSLAQARRGYVHRNNHGVPGGGPPGSTGYGKSYHYDRRFRMQGPPHDILARPAARCNPESVNFGQVQVGEIEYLQLYLINSGGTRIDIVSLSMDTSIFGFTQPDTFLLLPGDSTFIGAEFSPTAVGEFRDTLRFDFERGDDLAMPFFGEGVGVGISGDVISRSQETIRLFPNPFNDELRILFNGDESPLTVTIYDCAGRKIEEALPKNSSGQEASWIWHPQNLPAGLYFVEVATPDFNAIEKLIYLK